MATDFFEGNFKCKCCSVCKGKGCIGELPGMGGVDSSRNFILNCASWENLDCKIDESAKEKVKTDFLGIAPVTGSVQNIGFSNEEDFYFPYFSAAKNTGAFICVGDGAPDEKLFFGLKAVQKLNIKANFFLKPYPDDVLHKRIDLIRSDAAVIGYDIDAYNIVTMRNQVHLEKKSAEQLISLREYSKKPLAIKGVFTAEDIELCKKIQPEIVVISNHGGRIETQTGSTADFLIKNAEILKKCSGEIWVDGGLRTNLDLQKAFSLGARKVLLARPFISSLIKGGQIGMEKEILKITGN